MTDELSRDLPGADTNEMDGDIDAPGDPDRAGNEPHKSETTDEQSPWLKEGADAPDAADIEDPDAQR